ncbi:ATP-binding protein [Calditrichota bacterium]
MDKIYPSILTTGETSHLNASKLLQIGEFSSELVTMAPVGIVYLNQHGEILYINPKLLEMLEVPDATHRPQAEEFIFNLLIQEDKDGNPSILKRILKGQAHNEEEIEYVAFNGSHKWLNIYATPRHDKFGTVKGAVIVCVNVTGSKELREQLNQAQKMEAVGQLASGVAHDFNNLLTVINGHTELLQLNLPLDDNLQDHIREIEKAADSAAKLVVQLMEFSRKRPISQSVLNINAAIVNMKGMIKRLLTENIAFEAYLDPEINTILANGGQLEQVIVNLAVNAQHAMPRGGKLIIETKNTYLDEHYCRLQPDMRPGRYVMLAVSDSGFGMTEETKRKIFDPFFTTKAQGKGTGLGLSTVYGIVKQSHGHIMVYSELDRGTTFKIYFPVEEDRMNTSGERPDADSLRGGDETILLVEDEDSVRSIAIEILQELGYRVYSACDGEQAMEMFKTYSEDLDMLITDLGFPDSTGHEIANTMQGIKPNLKIIYMSGYTSNVAKDQGLLSPDSSFVQKPLQIKELADEIREVLDNSTPMDNSPFP